MEKSAGIIIFQGRKYLLLQYEAGHWDFPKGHIEKGESESEAALREAKEETGISGITLIKGFKEKISYYYKDEGKLIRKEVVFFLAKTKNVEVRLSTEHTGFEWLPFSEALEKITFRNSKEMLKKAETFLE